MTLPGIDQACFQTAVTDMTAITWAMGSGPLCEYPWSSRPSCARSVKFFGHETVMGRVDMQNSTNAAESGKRRITMSTGAWTYGNKR